MLCVFCGVCIRYKSSDLIPRRIREPSKASHIASGESVAVFFRLGANGFIEDGGANFEEIQISFLEELHRTDSVKLRKDIVPQVAAAYYSGGIIQILRYWVTSRATLSEELLVKQYSILLGMFLTE